MRTQLRIVLLQHARVVRVGVGHGDHAVALAGLREARVVDAGHADAERDGEGGLVRAQGHLVQHDRAEVALVLDEAAQVEELALRTPSTRGNGRRSVRLGVAVGLIDRWMAGLQRLLNLRAPPPVASAAGAACRRWGLEAVRGAPGGPAGRSTWSPRPRAAPRWRCRRGGTGRRARRGC